ncbi:hypothetical protein T8A63_11315 [Sulfitobacter sp. OXR-159]|uniref:hypothetical protein n=1 Tax=Sulfitobacter sp. OXR-159 TaxID=3100174 RepID=UPI002AC8B3EC|nr:hypothetical protein [Sulfitobacter sp. OXR-159]WPZ28249.1 hypothetical protein T8A63_11315 [Sulfitobacter sp. OXR-159]
MVLYEFFLCRLQSFSFAALLPIPLFAACCAAAEIENPLFMLVSMRCNLAETSGLRACFAALPPLEAYSFIIPPRIAKSSYVLPRADRVCDPALKAK